MSRLSGHWARDSKHYVVAWRYGIAMRGEPPIVHLVEEYATEKAQLARVAELIGRTENSEGTT